MQSLEQGVQDLHVSHPKRRANRHAYHTFDTQATPEPGPGPTGGQPGPATFVPGAQLGQLGVAGQPGMGANGLQNQPQPGQTGDRGSRVPSYTRPEAAPGLEAIPSVPDDRAYAQASMGDDPEFRTFEHVLPPPAATKYRVVDQGNSGPEFVRLSMYNVPATGKLRDMTKLPLGMLLSPFAEAQEPVPVVDFSQSNGEGPPRCNRCRAYMNPAMLFTHGGTRFTCNMCQFSNPVPVDYYQPIDANNRRIDWQERPELAHGTYDLVVPKDYWKDGAEPVPQRHMFLIDVCVDSMRREIPKLAVEAIRRSLAALPKGVRIAIVTFDRALHFYNLNPSLEQPQMMVVNDIQDPFVPLEEGLFVDPDESSAVIDALLSSLDVMFADSVIAEPAYGAALDVALKALSATGGRVTAVLKSLPTWGPGSLHIRESVNTYGDSDKELFKASNPFYIELARKYAKAGVGMDLFAFHNQYLDLANAGEVARETGGRTYYYSNFVPQRDGRKFIAEFTRAATLEAATQAVLKVRCSNGLQVAAYHGNMYHENWEEDPVFGAVDARTTVGCLFKHDGNLDTKLDAHFQAAILHTTAAGQRRVRVVNLLAAVTEQFRPTMNLADIDTCVGLMAREALANVGPKSLKEVRDGLRDKVVETFAHYRKHSSSNMPQTQLLMPIALRMFIIYVLALQKSRALRLTALSSDTRVACIRDISTLSADDLSLYLYPRIVALHHFEPDDCTYTEHGLFRMPENARATAKALDDGGAYLLFNSRELYLWISARASPNLLEDLFGVGSLDGLDPHLNALPEIDTPISRQTRALIDYYAREARLGFLGIQLARQGMDGAEQEFHAMLVEDRQLNMHSYQDFVANIHKNVKIFIENSNSRATRAILNDY